MELAWGKGAEVVPTGIAVGLILQDWGCSDTSIAVIPTKK